MLPKGGERVFVMSRHVEGHCQRWLRSAECYKLNRQLPSSGILTEQRGLSASTHILPTAPVAAGRTELN